MIRIAQLLLVLAAVALWVASRLTWVQVTSFDELGPPKVLTVTGAGWSTGLLPLALLLLAAALAALAVRGWLLRVVALLMAVACMALGYLGLSLIVMPDVGPRGAEL
ncbi:MAG: TIGR02234 family membrane protein, partial [Mycobacterium sp.]